MYLFIYLLDLYINYKPVPGPWPGVRYPAPVCLLRHSSSSYGSQSQFAPVLSSGPRQTPSSWPWSPTMRPGVHTRGASSSACTPERMETLNMKCCDSATTSLSCFDASVSLILNRHLQLQSVALFILFDVLVQFPQLGLGHLQLSLGDLPVAGDLVPLQLEVVPLISLPVQLLSQLCDVVLQLKYITPMFALERTLRHTTVPLAPSCGFCALLCPNTYGLEKRHCVIYNWSVLVDPGFTLWLLPPRGQGVSLHPFSTAA